MKKLLFVAFLSLMIVGCDQQQLANSFTKKDFGIYVYDSCEYLIGCHGSKGFLAHKGNCRFCIERRKQELKELVDSIKFQRTEK